MAKALIKQTEVEEVWKFWGTTLNETVTLSTDCLSPTMVVSGTPTVNINQMTWMLSPGASDVITVTRNSEPIFTLYRNGQINLAGNGFTDNRQNTSNIVVTSVGTGQLYLTIKKVAGFTSKVEPWAYGQYDNTTVTGS